MSGHDGLPRLLLLTDRSQLRVGRGLVRTVQECAAAGLRAVVVREHDLAARARHTVVAELADVPGLTVISSRLPDPAAWGLHLAADQPATQPGPWGRSCHAGDEVRRAAAEGASWATLSPYALTASKPGHGPPLDPAALAGHPIPVYALGGVDRDNAGAARRAGAHGVAVMGAVMRSADPAGTVGALLEAVGE